MCCGEEGRSTIRIEELMIWIVDFGVFGPQGMDCVEDIISHFLSHVLCILILWGLVSFRIHRICYADVTQLSPQMIHHRPTKAQCHDLSLPTQYINQCWCKILSPRWSASMFFCSSYFVAYALFTVIVPSSPSLSKPASAFFLGIADFLCSSAWCRWW